MPFANCSMCFLPMMLKVMKEFGYIRFTRVVFLILPSEFQVIISGSNEQQQKDSYESEVPFSVIHIVYCKFDTKIILMPLLEQ